jgi:hypothetical protein
VKGEMASPVAISPVEWPRSTRRVSCISRSVSPYGLRRSVAPELETMTGLTSLRISVERRGVGSADLARGRGLRSVAGQEERPGSWGEGPIAEACGSPSDRRLGLARPSALAVLRLMMSSNAHWGRQS